MSDFREIQWRNWWQNFPASFVKFGPVVVMLSRSQWPCGLGGRSSAARLLRSWVRIPPGAWMFVCCACCVLSGRGFCDGLITCPEESYRLWRVVVCDQETSKTRRLKPATGLWKIQPQWVVTPRKQQLFTHLRNRKSLRGRKIFLNSFVIPGKQTKACKLPRRLRC